jgi:hypothetical protein
MTTMKPIQVAPALLALLLGCSSVMTRSDSNPMLADEMARWQTYAWLPTPTDGDPRVYNDIIRARVQRAVDAELAARGYRGDERAPDFRIGWHAGIEDRLEIETLNDLYDYTWRDWYDPTYGTYVSEYSEGTLILDFIDADRNELAWRGVAEGRLRRTGPALPTAAEVDEAVDEIMEDFALRAGA